MHKKLTELCLQIVRTVRDIGKLRVYFQETTYSGRTVFDLISDFQLTDLLEDTIMDSLVMTLWELVLHELEF